MTSHDVADVLERSMTRGHSEHLQLTTRFHMINNCVSFTLLLLHGAAARTRRAVLKCKMLINYLTISHAGPCAKVINPARSQQ